MADVRLTATNPEDSSVVPVACNAKGELLLEEPTLSSDDYVAKAGDTMTGNLHLGDKITLNPDGSAQFANGKIDFFENGDGIFGGIDISFSGDGFNQDYILRFSGAGSDLGLAIPQQNVLGFYHNKKQVASIDLTGSAEFSSDVIVGSRGKKWMIVESNGLAHLVDQTSAATEYPPLRDIPSELTMVEQQLQKVLEKLRMIPEAGWEVWDGSD